MSRRVFSISQRCHLLIALIAPTLDGAPALLARERVTAILYDQDLPGIDWHKAVRSLVQLSPAACLILLPFVVGDRLRRNVLACGGTTWLESLSTVVPLHCLSTTAVD